MIWHCDFFSGTDDDGFGCPLSGCARFRLSAFFASDLSLTVIMYRAFGVNVSFNPLLFGVVYLFAVVHVFCSEFRGQ